ncbi:hypothetical protein STEG23_000492, partial [Scotinomys teguina]
PFDKDKEAFSWSIFVNEEQGTLPSCGGNLPPGPDLELQTSNGTNLSLWLLASLPIDPTIKPRTDEVAHQVKALAVKSNSLSLVPGTHRVEESIDSHKLSSDPHTHAAECISPYLTNKPQDTEFENVTALANRIWANVTESQDPRPWDGATHIQVMAINNRSVSKIKTLELSGFIKLPTEYIQSCRGLLQHLHKCRPGLRNDGFLTCWFPAQYFLQLNYSVALLKRPLKAGPELPFQVN